MSESTKGLPVTVRMTAAALMLVLALAAACGESPELAPTGSPATDRDVLIAFYHATDGPNWINNTNWISDAPLASWHGVGTDHRGRVTQLVLEHNQLRGELPPELGDLSQLRDFNFGWNQLSGAIPSALGGLSKLQLLNLEANQLRGEIPPELGDLSQLKELKLGWNRLGGAIPPALGRLSSLGRLWLNKNELGGEIPPELGNLASLKELALNGNYLSGAIPPELGLLANLEVLGASENQLSGAIPPELGNLANLIALWLSDNTLSGTIPMELGNLSSLKSLRLGDNQLAGCIPAGLRDIPRSDLAELGLPVCGTGEGLESATPAVNLDVDNAAETKTEAEVSAQATPEAVVQTAVSRTGLPTVGDKLRGDDGLEVALVSVQRFEQWTQVNGGVFRPENGLFQLMTITFNNSLGSRNIVVDKANIVLIEPDGNETAVDTAGVNALIAMATPATKGRPLFLVESVPSGVRATYAVVFDVDPGLIDLRIDIEGFLFEIPNP